MADYILHKFCDYEHIKDKSYYNHNYYRSKLTGDILLETCDDDNAFWYELCDEELKPVRELGSLLLDDWYSWYSKSISMKLMDWLT